MDHTTAGPIQRQRTADPVQITTTTQTQRTQQPLNTMRQQVGLQLNRQQVATAQQQANFATFQAPIQLVAKTPEELSPQAQLPKVNDKKKRKKYYAEQKKKATTKSGGLLDDEELASLEHLRTSKWGQKSWMEQEAGSSTQGEVYQQVCDGEYSLFEQLDVTLRNALATRFMRDHFVKPLPNQPAADYVRKLKEQAGTQGLMNPLFRLGLSLAMREGMDGIDADYFRQLDDSCGTELMIETLSRKFTPEEEPLLQEEATRLLTAKAKRNAPPPSADAVEARALALKTSMEKSQIFMATNLLMMHLGDAQKKTTTTQNGNKTTTSTPWDLDMATAFTHCSRVAFVTPAFKPEDFDTREEAKAGYRTMWRHLRGANDQGGVGSGGTNEYGMFHRGGSTHSFKQRKVGGNSPFKEKKVIFNPIGQEGVNVAVGGLLNKGVGGKLISMDGSCGHIYTMRKEEDANTCGGYLMGYESDAHTMTNQLGHTHGLGNGEYASSFGCQRTDEVGNKYGGREVDVSQVSVQRINAALSTLRKYMEAAHRTGTDTSGVMRRLAGKHMDSRALDNLLFDMSIRAEALGAINGSDGR